MVFNEETLKIEIEKTWGAFGAHAEVYNSLLSKIQKQDEELNIVHDCLTDLYNDSENRIGDRVKKCLDQIERLK